MTYPHTYGLAAEFEDPDELLAAARATREAGYRRFDGYSPYPIKDLDDVVPSLPNIVPAIGFGSGVIGGFVGYYMQYFLAAWQFPTNVGGRPLNSWPMFTVITFEMVVLFALAGVFFGTLFFQGLPSLYHPLFRIPNFKSVSADGFFLCIEARDARFDAMQTAHFLRSLDPVKVWEVDYE